MKFVFRPLGAFRILGKSLLTGIIPLAILFFVFKREWLFQEYAIVLVTVFELPLIIMFFQYYFNDRNTTFEISFEEKQLTLNRVSNQLTVPFSKIRHIEYVLPPGMTGKGDQYLYPQGDYFYLTFHLENGITFKVTSLLLRRHDIQFEEVTTYKSTRFLPFL
jgi:hypothetical protein